MVERRWNPRKLLEMQVAVYYNGLGILSGISRDISLKGIFIKLPSVQLPVNAHLDVVFSLGPLKNRQRVRLPAQIVHCEQDGVGAAFGELENSMTVALTTLVNQVPAIKPQSFLASSP